MERLIIEPPPGEELLAALTTPEEQARAEGFAPRRRREWLGWRALVRRELGAGTRIGYDAAGAPVLPGRAEHLSVSHCRDRIGIMIAPTPCALDIEPLGRRFDRAADRYMTPEERVLSDDPRWAGIVWCAKETLYKAAGRHGLDLCRDLRVTDWDPATGALEGYACGRRIPLCFEQREGCIVVRTRREAPCAE